ncbi:SDR family oxidoreductase [Wenzhouxiangella sp. XN24]|uniref:SDR family oxidoreductase n=1 Tax=Wenzhouxiangella sp. XN24 TaxID=2713569 RepID=UPI0013EDADA3|nr:SDR family oxidoreductase [Wenzhouxiangella sp. XN24]NGX16361.1 SDR family oxidoreductase [Wenzhouxiangella sp. XN24]
MESNDSTAGELPPPLADRHLFCFGCGYSAMRLGRELLAAGARVSGTSRTASGVDRLEKLGIAAHVFDGSTALPAAAFEGVTDVLSSIPPGTGGDDGVLTRHNTILADLPTLCWTALLSTTGVYGDTRGAWIDESAPTDPRTPGNERRVACEERWLAWGCTHGKPVQIFRLPGIYGPHRSPFARLLAGDARRIVKPGQVFNRIHVDDIVAALLLAMQVPAAGPVFHLADDEPAPADEVLTHAAALLGLPPPPAVPYHAADLPPMARHFYEECKRLSNGRARQELGFVPRYPTYREGLAAILAEEAAGQ